MEGKKRARTINDNTDGADSNFKKPKVALNTSLPNEVVSYLSGLAEHFRSENNDKAKKSIAEIFQQECEQYDAVGLFCSDVGDSLITVCHGYPELSIFFLNSLLKHKRSYIVQIFTNNIGSRCLESLLFDAVDRSVFDKSIQSVIELCQMAVDEFDRLCVDFSGCHVIRGVGRLLCGVRKDGSVLENQNVLLANTECRSLLVNLIGLVLNWKYMSNNLNQENISMMVQDFLELDYKHAKTNNFVQWFENCLKSDQKAIEYQLESKYGSRVWEKLISLCSEDDFELIFKEHFQGKLQQFSQHRYANFLVQRLLERCSTEEMTADFFDELLPCFEQLFSKRHFGVLVAMARAALQSKFRQKSLLKAIRVLIGCNTKSTVVYLMPCLLQFQSYNDTKKDAQGRPLITQDKMLLHGSLLIQNLLQFKKNKSIKNSLLHLNENDLVTIACSNVGSRIIDLVFTSSEKVASKEDKLNLLNKLKPHMTKLACDRVGSRVFETIFNNIDQEQKIQLGSLLLKKEGAVKSNAFGKIIYQKYRLHLLKTNRNQWKNWFINVNKN